MHLLRSLLICSLLLVGCITTHRQRGDFTGFLRQELLLRGGQIRIDAALPVVRGTWTYEPTDYGGCHIFLRNHKLEQVDALLAAAFGEPQKRDERPGKEPVRIYNKSKVGVSLLIVGKNNGVWIGCPTPRVQ